MLSSFIIGFHTARLDNLLQTLRFLEKNHLEVIQNSELILICQDKCDPIPNNFALCKHFNLDLPCMQLPYLTNFGVDKSISNKIIVLESDRILPKGYFQEVLATLQDGMQITTRKMLRPTKPFSDEEIEMFEHNIEYRSESNRIGMRNMWSGNTAFMKSDFYKAGKMDTAYEGYGWADSDMTWSMEKIGVKSIFREETEIHLWHPSTTYGEGDQKQMFLKNGLYFCNKWHQSLPNWFRQDLLQNKTLLLS